MYRRLALLATFLILALAVPGQAQTLGTGTIIQSGYGVNRVERVDDIDAHPDGGWVILDANHPWAGQHLTLTLTVQEVRAASAEEITHRHAHGAHGHHH